MLTHKLADKLLVSHPDPNGLVIVDAELLLILTEIAMLSVANNSPDVAMRFSSAMANVQVNVHDTVPFSLLEDLLDILYVKQDDDYGRSDERG